jgi:uncharacterized peroxidase-related enzyme
VEKPLALPEYQRLVQRSESNAPSSANLPVIEEGEAVGEVAALYEHFRSQFGRPQVPGILKCFATHPPLLRHMMALSASLLFANGALDRRLKEMIATFISLQNDCAYCADSHGYFLRVHGGSNEVLCALQASNINTTALSAAEQALLTFVQKVNLQSSRVAPLDVEALHRSGWNDLQIAEAIHLTALLAMFNRVANSFGLPSQRLLDIYSEQRTPAVSDKQASAKKGQVLA